VPDPDRQTTPQQFATTHWSVVLAATRDHLPSAAEALETLCRAYWYPLYAFVRRQGHPVEDAQDLTQEFFRRLLEKGYLAHADEGRGRFRTFLLTALQRFLISEWRRAQAAKRRAPPLDFWDGALAEARYAVEPATELTPAKLYERRWVILIIEVVLRRLREEAVQTGKAALFEGLKSMLWGDGDLVSYRDLSTRLGLSEGALRIAAHRFRRRCRELLCAEIAQTVADPAEVDTELQYLLEALS
jgi:RNA polymerase sigma-70 factor (ECF subfamily)